MNSQLPWVGYGSLETLATQIDPGKTVYVNGTTETLPGTHVATRVYSVRVSTLTPEAVHYLEMKTGTSQMIAAGQPLDPEHEKLCMQATEDAERLIGQWLSAKGFRVVKASVAEPKDVKLLLGNADFLRWDTTQRRYVAGDAPASR